MPFTKRRRAHLKAANAASVASFKKRRSESSLLDNDRRQSTISKCTIDRNPTDCNPTDYDPSDTEEVPATWFWNESANETVQTRRRKGVII